MIIDTEPFNLEDHMPRLQLDNKTSGEIIIEVFERLRVAIKDFTASPEFIVMMQTYQKIRRIGKPIERQQRFKKIARRHKRASERRRRKGLA